MYLQSLSPSDIFDYSLWKAIRKLKQPQQISPPSLKQDKELGKNRTRKSRYFAEHFVQICTLNPIPAKCT